MPLFDKAPSTLTPSDLLTLAPTYHGLAVTIVPPWTQGYAFRYYHPARRPTKAEGRKGTKRAWKKAHPRGYRWRWGKVEPKEMLLTPDRVFCTANQAAELKRAWVGEHRHVSAAQIRSETRFKPLPLSDNLAMAELVSFARLITERLAERESRAFRDLYLGKPYLDPTP